jgi:hypothetical protein
MAKERHVDALLKRLVQTIEASGFSTELTPQDKEFLRAVSIKPER